jgi:hypothetical protein
MVAVALSNVFFTYGGCAGIRPVFLYKPARNKGIAQEA